MIFSKKAANSLATNVTKIGLPKSHFKDIYHRVLQASWTEFLIAVATLYLSINAFWAFLYYMRPGSILNADPNSYWHAFVFSFQTSTTIGYGHFLPATEYANALVIADTLSGIIFVALITGLAFAKFSKPTARVIFSSSAVVTLYEGQKTLMFRMANARDSFIANARVEAVAVLDHTSKEGLSMQRIFDLKLIRSNSPVFLMSWTAMHIIDEDSPLYNLGLEGIINKNLRIVVSLTGIDDWSAQQVHTAHTYLKDDVSYDVRFKDILTVKESGGVVMDYNFFHETEPDSHPNG
ncbi:MAG: hypothetical protein KDD33_12215 [Bdellovibrionales bacterium]|nr:hypothetical protein [Bdellovibrionales bacterium]